MAKSRDLIRQQYADKLNSALDSNNRDELVNAFVTMSEDIQNNVLEDAQAYRETHDAAILSNRGVRVLTSEERNYYDGLIKAMSAPDVRAALAEFKVGMPETIIESITDNIQTAFPLLDAIDFTATNAITRMIVNKKGAQLAVWGSLGSAITKELDGAFEEIDVTHNKLSAYMLVSDDMLKEGPTWVDAYVRAVLQEALGLGFTQAVVAGTGKDQPIGMTKDLAGAVTEGVYPDKTATKITKLDPKTFGAIAAGLATDANGRARTVDNITMVVNPVDYFNLVMPATTYLNNVGVYVQNLFPFPTTVIQDVNVPSGKAIFGLAKMYKLCAGFGGKGGTVEFSDEYKFLDDVRTYKVKTYADGRPMDNNAFVARDISGLTALS